MRFRAVRISEPLEVFCGRLARRVPSASALSTASLDAVHSGTIVLNKPVRKSSELFGAASVVVGNTSATRGQQHLLLNTGIWKMLQTYVGHHARGNVCSDAPPAPGLSRSVLVHVLRCGRAGLCVSVCACVCVCVSVKTMAPAPTFPMSPRPSQLRIMTRFLEARSKG